MVGHPDEIDFQHGDGSEFLNVVITVIQTIYIYRMHVYAYTIWIHNDSHTVYIYLANVLIAQKVFREVGLKCPLSVSSIYKC